MPLIVFHLPDGATRRVAADAGTNVMAAAVANGVPGITGDCGGSMTCATCQVVVREPQHLRESSEEEHEMLEALGEDPGPGSRLGCQVRASVDDTTIDVEITA